jgi:hypothetical protein
MNRLYRLGLAVVWTIVISVAFDFFIPSFDKAIDTIDYKGESFKLTKFYASYEDYKDDPDNLDTNELPLIEKAIVNAKFPLTFASRRDFFHALFGLNFPGYGLETNDRIAKTDDGSQLEVDSVEIPQTDKNRVLVVRTSSSPLVLLDDFVSTNIIAQVELKAGKLLYHNPKGVVVREQEAPMK